MECLTISVKEAAQHLGICKESLYKLIREGKFSPVMKIGDKTLVLKREFEEWIEKQKGVKV